MTEQRVYRVEVPAGMSLEDGLAEAQAKARGAGISIEGGVEGGIFHGVAEGRYSVEGRTLCLQVEKKPAFVTWGLVEMGLRQVFGDVNVAS